MSLPPIDRVEYNFDFGGGVRYKIIVYADCTICRHLVLKKDLYSVDLRWYLLSYNFNFKVRDKGGSRIEKLAIPTLTDLAPA